MSSSLHNTDKYIGNISANEAHLNPSTNTRVIDYDTFLADDFDANKYTSAITTETEAPVDETDISTELSKLTFSIEIVNKQIQEQVNLLTANLSTATPISNGPLLGCREL